MKKNDELVGIVQAIGSNCEGIIKENGTIVFVPFVLVGEKIRYKVLKVTSKCAYGKVLEVLTPAEPRIRPQCPVFTKCGGCQLQHLRYVNQLKIKEENVEQCFKKVANLNVVVSPAVKGDDQFRYRNKLQLPVSFDGGQTRIGFYAENSHRVVPIDDCIINAPWTKDVISAFRTFIDKYSIKGYDELNNCGELREITVKEIKGNLIITAVITSDNLRNVNDLVKIIKEKVKYPFSLYLNVNDKKTNVIFGEQFKLIYGNPYYMGDMLGIKYKIGVQSFMQVNNSVCLKLYSQVRDAINADKDTVVIDAYSGAGLMTALLCKEAKQAIGIEIIKEATEFANELAALNKLEDKITNYNGKCEEILPDIIAKEKQKGSKVCLVLDPPRKGCDIKVINSIIESDIDRIVYVSCLPSTLARDVGLLVGSLKMVGNEIKRDENYSPRYEISFVKPFDMFANTKHVETVVCLNKIH